MCVGLTGQWVYHWAWTVLRASLEDTVLREGKGAQLSWLPCWHVFLLWPFWKCLLHSLDVIQPQSPLSVSFEPWLWIDTLWCPWLCKHRLTETSFRSCLFWLVRWYTEGPSEVFASVCFILRVCHTTASCLLNVLSSVKWDLVTLQYQWIFQWTFWNARNRCLKRSFLIRHTCSFLLHE